MGQPLDGSQEGAYSPPMVTASPNTPSLASADMPSPVGRRGMPSPFEQRRRQEWGRQVGALIRSIRQSQDWS